MTEVLKVFPHKPPPLNSEDSHIKKCFISQSKKEIVRIIFLRIINCNLVY
jgi:hypothetical protein